MAYTCSMEFEWDDAKNGGLLSRADSTGQRKKIIEPVAGQRIGRIDVVRVEAMQDAAQFARRVRQRMGLSQAELALQTLRWSAGQLKPYLRTVVQRSAPSAHRA